MRAFLRAGLLAGSLSLLLSCSDPAPLGAVMLAMQTDMALPDDVTEVSLVVRSEDEATFGRILHQESLLTYDTATGRYVRFPATFAVVEGEQPNRRVRIRLAAYDRTGAAIVLNEAVTVVPHERVALLRLPLQFLAQTSVKAGNRSDPDGVVSSCPNVGEVEVAGVCRSPEIDSKKLPDYDPKDVFGGGDGSEGSGTCFSIPTCLEGAAPVGFDKATCSAPLPRNSVFNLALLRTGGPSQLGEAAAGAMCIGDQCYVPIDEDPDYGWRRSTDGTRIEFTKAICDAMNAGRVADVVGSGVCAAKTPATPICAPWSASSESQVAPAPDGAPGLDTQSVPPTGPFGMPERVSPPEPGGIRAMGLRGGFVYGLTVGQGDSNPSNNGRAKLIRLDKAAPGQPTVVFASDPDADGLPNTGYRMAIGQTALAMVDVTTGTAFQPPSKAYVVQGYDATPSIKPVVGTGGQIVRGVVASGPGLYWLVELAGSLQLLASAPAAPETLAPLEYSLPPIVSVFAEDSGLLYFGGPMGISTCMPSTGMCLVGTSVALGAAPAVALAFDATDVYAVDFGPVGHLYRFAKSQVGGTAMPAREIGDTQYITMQQDPLSSTPFGLAVDDTYVYYVDRTGLHYVPKADLTATPGDIAPGTQELRSVAVDDTHVYYGTMGGPEPAVYRVQKQPQGM